jgi:hypothetical protein
MKNIRFGKVISAAVIAVTVFSLVLIATPVSASSLEGRGGPGGQGGYGNPGSGVGLTTTSLTSAEIEALSKAILEEYGALNTYHGVMEQFGEVYPFALVARAEQQHVKVLMRLADRYGVSATANPGLSTPLVVNSISEACEVGVKAEIVDADLYTELMKVTTHTDILRVYTNLQRASLENHLPKFEACIQ